MCLMLRQLPSTCFFLLWHHLGLYVRSVRETGLKILASQTKKDTITEGFLSNNEWNMWQRLDSPWEQLKYQSWRLTILHCLCDNAFTKRGDKHAAETHHCNTWHVSYRIQQLLPPWFASLWAPLCSVYRHFIVILWQHASCKCLLLLFLALPKKKQKYKNKKKTGCQSLLPLILY